MMPRPSLVFSSDLGRKQTLADRPFQLYVRKEIVREGYQEGLRFKSVYKRIPQTWRYLHLGLENSSLSGLSWARVGVWHPRPVPTSIPSPLQTCKIPTG